ncbi:hypothetical protein BH23CHL5_BH23CHL5_17110 [soil metagenome]
MSETSSHGPIRLVTFDLYDTLIELHPKRWERLQTALDRIGVASNLQLLRSADLVAEDFFTIENGKVPIRDRAAAEREQFRLEYMRIWLQAAGIIADDHTVRSVREQYMAEYETPAVESGTFGGYQGFADVVPALRKLQQAGIKRAVISNADDDVTELCTQMAFAHEMNLIVTSAIVGYEKPDPRTFRAAFEPLDISPADVLHIGDQPQSDVVGALNVGMRAALIDRYHRHDPAIHEVPIFTGLLDLVDHVLEANAADGSPV